MSTVIFPERQAENNLSRPGDRGSSYQVAMEKQQHLTAEKQKDRFHDESFMVCLAHHENI
jgi:hypothetical protein